MLLAQLPNQVVNIATIRFTKHGSRSQHAESPPGIPVYPVKINGLCLVLGSPVIIDEVAIRAFIQLLLGEPVDSHGTGENDLRDTKPLGSNTDIAGALHVHIVVERYGPDIILMLRRQVVNDVATLAGAQHIVDAAHIAGEPQLRIGFAVLLVDDAYGVAGREQAFGQPGADKTAAANEGYSSDIHFAALLLIWPSAIIGSSTSMIRVARLRRSYCVLAVR